MNRSHGTSSECDARSKVAAVLLTPSGEQVAAHWENHASRSIDDIATLIAEIARSLVANRGLDFDT